MTVSLTTPLNEYVGNGSSKTFPYSFRTTNTNQIKVYLAGVLQTSGYTVDQYDLNAGNIIFAVAPPIGAEVRIQRNIPISRSNDYLDGGALTAAALDNDFDNIIMMVQDLDAQVIKELDTSILDAQDKHIVNVSNPYSDTDAANKIYVDTSITTAINGLNTVFNATTTDSVQLEIFAKSIPNSFVGLLNFEVIGKNRTGSTYLIYQAIQPFSRTTGTLELVGTINELIKINTSTAAYPTITVSSNNLKIWVEGAAATTYDWVANAKVTYVGNGV